MFQLAAPLASFLRDHSLFVQNLQGECVGALGQARSYRLQISQSSTFIIQGRTMPNLIT